MDIQVTELKITITPDEAIFLKGAVETKLIAKVKDYALSGEELDQFKSDYANEIKMYHDLVKNLNPASTDKNDDFDWAYRKRVNQMNRDNVQYSSEVQALIDKYVSDGTI